MTTKDPRNFERSYHTPLLHKSKTDVDQPEWVGKRITVEYKRFPVEPVSFCIFFLSFYQKFNPSYHTQSTHNPQASTETNIYTCTLCTRAPTLQRCTSSSNSNNPRLFLSATDNKQWFQHQTGMRETMWSDQQREDDSSVRQEKKPLLDCFSTNY